MSSKSFRWCFIGTGTLAGKVAKEITASGRHRIASVYTRRLEKGQEFAIKYGGLAYRTPEEAMQAESVDGVYIVTPHNSHFQYAKTALQLGKPVLCEKPLTMTAQETAELISISREKQVYLAEGMWTWFSPVANQVKAWLVAGEFGELQTVRAHYHLDVRSYAPRLTDPMRAGGALLDSGIYPIWYLYKLFGMPVKVECQGHLQDGIDYGEEVSLTFSDGSVWPASVSIRDFQGLEKLQIAGSKAKLSMMFFHKAAKAKLIRQNGKNEVFRGNGSLLNEFDIVSREIAEGRQESAMVPLEDTLAVMKILDECRRQMGLVYPFEDGLPPEC